MNRKLRLAAIILAFVFIGLLSTGAKSADGSGYQLNGLGHDSILQYHHNILLVSDMTNRLDLFPKYVRVHDTTIIGDFFKVFKKEVIHTNGRRTGQKDCITWSTLSPARGGGQKVQIDLGVFKNQMERIKYVTHTNQMDIDISQKTKAIRDVYESRSASSGDVYSYLENELNGANVKINEEYASSFGSTIIRRYDNVLILFTDGYLEYGLNQKAGIQNYEWSSSQIENFRRVLIKSGLTVHDDLSDVRNLPRIVPVVNSYLKDVRVLCIGFHDRSTSSTTGSARVRPSDKEINKYVWKDWLLRSGAKEVEIYGHMDSREEAEKVIMDFIRKVKK